MYKLENNGGGGERICKKVHKIAKWSVDFLYDFQLQICLASEIFQVNNFLQSEQNDPWGRCYLGLKPSSTSATIYL